MQSNILNEGIGNHILRVAETGRQPARITIGAVVGRESRRPVAKQKVLQERKAGGRFKE